MKKVNTKETINWAKQNFDILEETLKLQKKLCGMANYYQYLDGLVESIVVEASQVEIEDKEKCVEFVGWLQKELGMV